MAPSEAHTRIWRSRSIVQPATTPCSTNWVVCTVGASDARASSGVGSSRHARSINGMSRSRIASIEAAESVNATTAYAIHLSSLSGWTFRLVAPRVFGGPSFHRSSPLPLYGRCSTDGSAEPDAWGQGGACTGCARAPKSSRRSSSIPAIAVAVCPSH